MLAKAVKTKGRPIRDSLLSIGAELRAAQETCRRGSCVRSAFIRPVAARWFGAAHPFLPLSSFRFKIQPRKLLSGQPDLRAFAAGAKRFRRLGDDQRAGGKRPINSIDCFRFIKLFFRFLMRIREKTNHTNPSCRDSESVLQTASTT